MTRALDGVQACVFDAYGTLFDFASAAARCPDVPEDRRAALTALWRDKQLQYSWLRTLENRYADFWQVTGDALDFALESLDLETPSLTRAPDGPLSRPRAVSRGSRRARDPARGRVQNRHPFQRLAHDARSAGQALGPRGDVRRRPVRRRRPRLQDPPRRLSIRASIRSISPASAIAFQSSNAWDAHGASDFGMRVVWCNRYGQRRERLPGSPDFEIRTLAELPALLGAADPPDRAAGALCQPSLCNLPRERRAG